VIFKLGTPGTIFIARWLRYVHVMYSIIKQSNAENVLMICGASGMLATMLYRSGCHVTAVDINPHAFTLAKKYFQMPDEVECVVGDGCGQGVIEV
jgi:protein-L-isoaspartate O-methyltransferase